MSSADPEAFAASVAQHRPLLLAVCRRMLNDAALAEDAAQEAVLTAWLNLDRLREPGRFGAWLAGIGANVCRGFLRRAAWSQPLDERVASSAPDPAAAAETAEVVTAVRRAITELPPGQRAAVALFALDGLSQREVAAALGTTIGAVKTRLHKARAALRTALAAHWEEDPMAIHVRVGDVHQLPEDRFVVLLEEQGGGRRLPIWIGPAEALWLAHSLERAARLPIPEGSSSLEDVDVPRPGPYHLAARLLETSRSRLREVRVARLDALIFYATLEIEGPDGAVTVDARPSDALNLALQTGAPITVEQTVFAAAADCGPRWGADRVLADSQDTARGIVEAHRQRQQAMLRAFQAE